MRMLTLEDRLRNRELLRKERANVRSFILGVRLPSGLSASAASCTHVVRAVREQPGVEFAQILWLRPPRLYFGVKACDNAGARRLGQQVLRLSANDPFVTAAAHCSLRERL